MIPCMTNIKGLDPIPRGYHPDVAAEHIPFLEDIRRASNAVRVLRRRGLPHATAELRLQQACDRYSERIAQEEHERSNPPLF